MVIRMTVARRLTALSAAAGMALAGLGGLACVDSNVLADHANEIQQISHAVRLQMRADMAHDAIRAVQLSALLAAHRQDMPSIEAAAQELRNQQQTIEESLAQLAHLPLSADVRDALRSVGPRLQAYVRSANDLVAAASRSTGEAEALQPAFRAAFSGLEVEMARVSDLIERHAQTIRDDSEVLRRQTLGLIVLCTAMVSGLLVGLGLWTSRAITRRLGAEPEDLARVAQTIASGELRQPVDAHAAAPTSVLAAMAHMQAELQRIVAAVRQGADAIATGSREIAIGNTDLSQRTEQQAASLQETAATMEELHATVKHSADTAVTATDLAGQASHTAVLGGEAVHQVVQVMDEINASSKRIGDILTVIDGIAFQTNILALNAAVEAARAGEQGRGFAVVAGEVRGLARRCTDAAKEIKGLIETSVGKVDAGTRLVGQAGDTIGQVVQQVQRVNDLIGGISTAAQEQTAGIGGVNRAVSELDQVTQQNAALVEQSAAAAESLKQQAQALVGAVSVFKLPPGVVAPA